MRPQNALDRIRSLEPPNLSPREQMVDWIPRVRRVPLLLTILAIVGYITVISFSARYLINNDVVQEVSDATRNLISPTWIIYLPLMLGLLLFWWPICKLQWSDLAIRRVDWLPAVVWIPCLWILGQLIYLPLLPELHINPEWTGIPLTMIGQLVTGQMIGNAMVEELFFRAFLISQITLVLRKRTQCSMKMAIFWSATISLLLFTIMHLPRAVIWNDTTSEIMTAGLLVPFVGGIALTLLFLISGNLLLTIGVHALVNTPSPLLDLGSYEGVRMRVIIVFTPIILIGVWRLGLRAHQNS